MCDKPLPARRVHDHGHAFKISSYGGAAGERKCFYKVKIFKRTHHDSKAGGGKLENPSHMNLRGVRPTLVFALGSDPLSSSSLTTWGDYWCPIFLPYLKLFLEKILRSVYQGNTFDCWFSAARWRGALQSRSWLPIRKTFEAFLLGRHLCCEGFDEKNWKNIDLLLHLRSIDISLQEILHHLQVACT